LALCSPAFAVIAHVNDTPVDCGGGNTGCNIPSTAYTNGNSVWVGIVTGTGAINTTPAVIGVPSSSLGTFTCQAQVNFVGKSGGQWVGIRTCCAQVTASTASYTIAVSTGATADIAAGQVQFSGTSGCSFDTGNTGESTGSVPVTTLATGTYSTVGAPEIGFAVIGDDSSCIQGGLSATSGFTLATTPTCASIGFGTAYQIYTVTQTNTTASWGFASNTDEIGTQAAVYKVNAVVATAGEIVLPKTILRPKTEIF